MLFREYVQAFKGLRRVSYSRGLKVLLGIADKTDQALLREVETVQVLPTGILPDGASVVQIVADISTQAVKDISVADRWDLVMDIFRRSVHKELTFHQVGYALSWMWLRVMMYKNGVMGIYSMNEPIPETTPDTLSRMERVL